MLAKLLWNPDINIGEVMDDFLDGYYGPAGRPIRKYIDLLHDSLEKTGERNGIWEGPQEHANGFLSAELMEQYDAFFDEAEHLVAGDEEVLFRVQTARMPLMYAKLELEIGSPADRKEMLESFYDLTKRNGIRRLSEHGNSPEEFKAAHETLLNEQLGA